MTLSTRIKQARNNAGLSQTELADKVGVSQTAIHKIEHGSSRSSRRTVSIALACGVDPIWLETGRGEMLLPGASSGKFGSGEEYSHQLRPHSIIARVPLVSWDMADKFCRDQVEFGELESKAKFWVPVAPKSRAQCFALNVKDDTMEPLFAEGDNIIVDPSLKGGHTQFVIAQFGDQLPLAFKQLMVHGNQSYLKPTNPRYPLISVEEGLKVCGVVISKYRDFMISSDFAEG